MSRTALYLLAVVLCGAMTPWLLSSAASKENLLKKSDAAAFDSADMRGAWLGQTVMIRGSHTQRTMDIFRYGVGH